VTQSSIFFNALSTIAGDSISC